MKTCIFVTILLLLSIASLPAQGTGLEGLSAADIKKSRVNVPKPTISGRAGKYKITLGGVGAGSDTAWQVGRGDFNYLPAAQFNETDSIGWNVYYRCAGTYFQAVTADDVLIGWKIGMTMLFDNDRGGDVGVAAWRKEPSDQEAVRIRFTGFIHRPADLPAGPDYFKYPKPSWDSICDAAFYRVDQHRPKLEQVLIKRDLSALQNFYDACAYVPGLIGTACASQGAALSLALRDYPGTAMGAGCLVYSQAMGVALKTATRSAFLQWFMPNFCSAGNTTYNYVTAPKRENPLFEGSVKYNGPYKIRRLDGKTGRSLPDAVVYGPYGLGYIAPQSEMLKIFFMHWR